MSQSFVAHLADRGVVAVTGPDAGKLLQGLITNDMALLESRPALFAGLLSPQGKILFEFFAATAEGGYLLDVAHDRAADLAKRLTMYKLRADVTIADASDRYAVMAMWGADRRPAPEAAVSFSDPRLPEMGERWIVAKPPPPVRGGVREDGDAEASTPGEPPSPSPSHQGEGGPDASGQDLYHSHRIALGVPAGGRDYALGDTFPHEALYDQLHGVSFTKGCYVGQEIVSRMEHRGTARKRVVQIAADAPLPATGAEIMAGDVAIGSLGSVDGSRGLALVRLDRAAEARAKGVALTAGGIPITISKPEWAGFELAVASSS